MEKIIIHAKSEYLDSAIQAARWMINHPEVRISGFNYEGINFSAIRRTKAIVIHQQQEG